jgi:L-asparaginase II
MVAGTGRFCTDVMAALDGRVFVKTGAEGVFIASIPEKGVGVALKCEDGATRAAEAMMAAVIEALLPLDDSEREALEPWLAGELVNWNGRKVGAVRPVADAFRSLRGAAG